MTRCPSCDSVLLPCPTCQREKYCPDCLACFGYEGLWRPEETKHAEKAA